MRTYTDPQAAGYLLEAKACEKVSKELRRLAEKYQRYVDKEQKGREAEFEAVMGYTSEDEIREAYGWSFITEAQMERYIDIFRTGQAALEQHTPTCNELVYRILCRICREIEDLSFDVIFQACRVTDTPLTADVDAEYAARRSFVECPRPRYPPR